MDNRMKQELENHITGVYRETRTKTKHARISEFVPFPWKAENGLIKFIDHGQWRTFASVDKAIFTPDGRAGCAEAIVRACNSHYDLVKALETLVREADEGNPFCSIGHLIEHVVPHARAALAKAKGEA